VFLEVVTEDRDEVVYLALTKKAAKKKDFLHLNLIYAFSGLQKCSWRRSKPANVSDDTSQNCGTVSESKTYWYIGDDSCEISLLSSDCIRDNHCHENIQLSKGIISTGSNVMGDIHNRNIDRPSSTYLRSVISSREIVVEGVICKLNALGWIEMFLRFPVVYSRKDRKVNVFITHYTQSDTTKKLRVEAAVRISFVLPIYLWGKLHGFAATVRSHIEILESVRDLTNNSNHIGNQEICGGKKRGRDDNINNSSPSKTCVTFSSDISSSRVSADVSSTPPPARFRVPPDLRTRCHTYAAWRAYVLTQFNSAVAAQVSVITSDNNSRSAVRSDTAGSRSSTCVTAPVLTKEILDAIEGRHSTLLHGDGGTGLDTTVSTNNNNGNSGCRSSSSSGSSSSSVQSGSESRKISNTCSSSPEETLDRIFSLPQSRSFQEEFMDPHYTELFMIRCAIFGMK
jgi:hypothetical protein